jgi:hypothetical protein
VSDFSAQTAHTLELSLLHLPRVGFKDHIYSEQGFATKEAAMEKMLDDMSQEVWQKLREEGIKLPK